MSCLGHLVLAVVRFTIQSCPYAKLCLGGGDGSLVVVAPGLLVEAELRWRKAD